MKPAMEPNEITRFGAYLGLHVPPSLAGRAAAAPVPELAARLGLENEFAARGGEPTHAIAFLRRMSVTPGAVDDPGLLAADVVVHAASPSHTLVAEFAARLASLLEPPAPQPVVLAGVVRPTRYTGGAMHDFAYAHQLVQQSGATMPNTFLLPLVKTRAWWDKTWMERHTYFLPRYDGGRMTSEGHALAAEKGIATLMRRTYRNVIEPAPPGEYDFLTYFECSDEDAPVFDEVCSALRNVARNPEWAFVREGPTWRGRRAATWEAAVASAGEGP